MMGKEKVYEKLETVFAKLAKYKSVFREFSDFLKCRRWWYYKYWIIEPAYESRQKWQVSLKIPITTVDGEITYTSMLLTIADDISISQITKLIEDKNDEVLETMLDNLATALDMIEKAIEAEKQKEEEEEEQEEDEEGT